MATGIVPKYLSTPYDSGWQTIVGTAENSETFIGTIYYRKWNGLLEISGSGLTPKQNYATGNMPLCTLPEAYRPGYYEMVPVVIHNNRTFAARFAWNGTLYIYPGPNNITTSNNIFVSVIGMV